MCSKIEHMSSTEALSFTGYLEIEALKTHGGVYLHVPILDLIDTNNITTQAWQSKRSRLAENMKK